MIRLFSTVIKNFQANRSFLQTTLKTCPTISLLKQPVQNVSFCVYRRFSVLTQQSVLLTEPKISVQSPPQVRTVTKYSLKKGKRKSVKAALKRFFRLHWGGWIRTKCGRKKKLWKKSARNKFRLQHHVFCNSTQCTLLDKMVTKFWRTPKYYVDDPYAPYHEREEFSMTRKKPLRQ